MNDSRLKQIGSVDEVVEAVGGTFKAAALVRKAGLSCQPPAISNARARGTLPPATFLIFAEALAERGYRAPPELWRIKEPRARRRRTRH
jgi:hypothetical protein